MTADALRLAGPPRPARLASVLAAVSVAGLLAAAVVELVGNRAGVSAEPRDWVLALLCVPLGARVEGAAAVRALVMRLMTAYSSDFRREPGSLAVGDGTTYAFEWTESGTNDLDGRFPATGRRFTFPVVSVGRLRDGRIVEHKDYWDLADYLQQVGVSVPAGGQ